jgi:hypothetical protein
MNMKKRLALVLVLVLLASAATTAFASPFADVPADHWAYDSVAELAAAGLIEGYPDGTYGGARMMTRYEAAMVFARALHRLEAQIADNNILPELDKIKAELMAEIEAKMAAAGKPVVETIETTIVEQRIDEEGLARVAANEKAIEALGGDMAYLEARMVGLIEGIRHDLSKLEEREPEVVVVEQPSMDEIEALMAARIQEALLGVASGVKETTIVERVVSTTPELSRTDVELIAEALIRKQLQDLSRTVQENRDLITGLVDWVDELDTNVATLKEDVEGLKTSVAKLEKAPVLSGDLTLKGEYKAPTTGAAKDYVFTQTGNLTINIKASESTDVKAILGYEIGAGSLEDTLSNYRVEVTSKTPVNKLIIGKMPKANLAPFVNRYVLASKDYEFGGLAKINIIDNLTLDLYAGQAKVEAHANMQAAGALQYKFMPEIGIRLAGALQKPTGEMFTNYAAGVGLFGEVAGITYNGDFAMDFNASEKNYLAVVEAKATFEPVTIDGKFVYQEENYKVTNQLLNAERKFGVEGGAKVALDLGGFGVNFGARAYYEGGAQEVAAVDASEDVGTVLAFKVDADTTFDLFVPVTLAGRFVGNTTGPEGTDMETNIFAKLSVDQKPAVGLRYGAYAAYEKNVLTDVAWKNVSKFTGKDKATFGANVGYGLVWNGAKVDLDYAATFGMPIVAEDEPAEDNTLSHKVDVKYGFTDNVTLTLGGTVNQTLSDPWQNSFLYNAGLTVKF